MFERMDFSSGTSVATRWSLLNSGLNQNDNLSFPSPRVDTKDMHSQTATPIERMVINCMSKSVKQELYDKIPLIEKMLDEVDLL